MYPILRLSYSIRRFQTVHHTQTMFKLFSKLNLFCNPTRLTGITVTSAVTIGVKRLPRHQFGRHLLVINRYGPSRRREIGVPSTGKVLRALCYVPYRHSLVITVLYSLVKWSPLVSLGPVRLSLVLLTKNRCTVPSRENRSTSRRR